jgi:hypothetical protein
MLAIPHLVGGHGVASSHTVKPIALQLAKHHRESEQDQHDREDGSLDDDAPPSHRGILRLKPGRRDTRNAASRLATALMRIFFGLDTSTVRNLPCESPRDSPTGNDSEAGANY